MSDPSTPDIYTQLTAPSTDAAHTGDTSALRGDVTASPFGLAETDRGNAARLAEAHRGRLVHVIGKGWGVRLGQRYTFRGGERSALGAAMGLADLVRAEAAAAERVPVGDLEAQRYLRAEGAKGAAKQRFGHLEAARDHLAADRRARLEDWALKCENLDRITASLKMAAPALAVDIEDLDSDPASLTVPEGRIDLDRVAETPLETAGPALIAARREWLQPQDWGSNPTRCTGAHFDPAADCPAWRAFLGLIMPRPEMRDYLHRALGRLVYGMNEGNKCYLFRGSGGNGKSTLVDIVGHVLGTREGYAEACKVDMFLVTKGPTSPGQATPEEVDLPGARAYIASEPAPTDTFCAKKIKALTGGDRRPVRGLNRDQFYYYPRGTPIISFNRTPNIKDEDEGTRRRLEVFQFEAELHKLPPEQQRKPAEVMTELRAEAPGILNWLLDGWRLYRAIGLGVPEAMQDLKAELLDSADPVGGFLRDCCAAQDGGRINVTDLHTAFEAWCGETGVHPWGQMAFGRAMQEKGFKRRKASARYWAGLTWASDPFAETVLRRANLAPAAETPDAEPEDFAG